jgi:hypothetical protein
MRSRFFYARKYSKNKRWRIALVSGFVILTTNRSRPPDCGGDISVIIFRTGAEGCFAECNHTAPFSYPELLEDCCLRLEAVEKPA